jgi:hypothetical protein
MWLIRLQALAWAEFQYGAKLMKKGKALDEVVQTFGLKDVDPVRDWKKRAEGLFGCPFVRENLQWAREMGKRYRYIQEQLGRGKLKQPEVAHEMQYFMRVFDSKRLKLLAKGYKDEANEEVKFGG